MTPNLKSIIVLLLLYNVIVITVISVSGQEFQSDPFVALSDGERNKRAFDLGFLVRNILLKSAYASNTKAAVSRNLLNAKLTKTTTTTTTTTPRPTTRRPAPATLAPLFFNKKSFLFPFDFSASSGAFQPFNKFNNVQGNPAAAVGGGGTGGLRGGFMNFDYDYGDPQKLVAPARRRRPTTTTAAPTTTTTESPSPPPPPPAPPAALPPRLRPFGGYGGRRTFLNYDYYDDYDYPETEPTTPAPPPPPPPPPSRRPRLRRPPQQNQARGPMPPLRMGARQGRLQRLRDPFNYQYAQKNDISINNGNAVQPTGSAPATAVNANANVNNQTTNANDDAKAVDDSDDANANDDDDTTSPQVTNEQTNQDASSDDYDAGANAAFDPSNIDDYNDSSDNANTNANSTGNGSNNDNTPPNTDNGNNGSTNRSPLNNFDSNPAAPPAPSLASDQFADFPIGNAQGQGPSLLRPFGGLPSGYQNFQFPLFNDFNTQYHQPSSPVGYSVRYY